MKKYLFILLLISGFGIAQVETSNNLFLTSSYPAFYVDMANYRSDSVNKTRVDLFVQVPYSNIQFIRTPKGFTAKYGIHLTFFDEDNEGIILEKMWNETVEASNFEQAASQLNYNYSYRTFDLKPAKYNIRCTITDKDSKKTYEVTAVINVVEFDDSINLSDILFISGTVKDKDGERIIPNISNQVFDSDSSIAFYYDIYSSQNKNVKVNYTITNREDEVILQQKKDFELTSGVNSIINSFANQNFALGKFKLSISIEDESNGTLATSSKYFYSTILGFPKSITDIEDAIEQMEYIASKDEIEIINEVEDRQVKLKRFKSFWSKKDPTKGTIINEHFVEYYRRVEYANSNFESYYKGWRTDMGMVYVMLGAPDAVERHPFEINSKPYEVWDYYDLNKRFVFVDQTGFGDYRLLNQDYGDWYRYRY
ncbi:MAG: GWxTD domain-containing protein [Melioribacteraceae bacterium]|nr:GWxTD domain-containing protein [Melioribacteraceae bacterium]MCF8412226.1 GWxTD domain-containing protein [Melioribacteraceae bacterium]MCF8431857.1 GWxTD domain-containing protein [Melioribacteraceae bacterium]